MTTTIQLQEETAQKLKRLKEQTGSKSYDELINTLTSPKQLREQAAGYLKKHITPKQAEEIRRELND